MKNKIIFLLVVGLTVCFSAALGTDIYYRGKISPFRIIQKSQSALYESKSYEQIMEEWYQGFLVHRKSKYTQRIKDLTDSEVEGRISYSYYGFSLGDSDSYWVKSYTIRGVPFTWNSRKKKWKNEALHIEDKYAREQISYNFLYALAGVDLEGIDPESFQYLGEEEKDGKTCYLISFRYLPDMYKRWGLVGKLSSLFWVEKETFLPVQKRTEGNIAGSKYLLVVAYQNYGQDFDFALPVYVVEESAKEKKALEAKVQTIIEAVAKLRGWQAEEIKDVKIEFAKKVRIKDAMLEDTKSRFSEQEVYYQGEMLKWLGLIPKDADYYDIFFDSSDAAFIAGLYIPKIKTIFVSDDMDPAQAELTLFHEAVHAFQDKKLGLESLQDKLKDDYNAYTALMSLIEGEAVSLELEYLLNKSEESLKEWEDIARLIDERVVHGYARDKVFFNVYGYGAMFLQNYLKKHSWDWSQLNNIYAARPETMEEVLHPEEYTIKSVTKGVNKSSKLTPPPLESHKISGWKEVYASKLGEFYIFSMLDDKLKRAESQSASLGWSNDRIDIYEDGQGGQLIVLQTKWDSPKDASEFFESYKKWLKENKFTDNPEQTGKDIFANSESAQLTACSLGNNYVLIAGSRDLSPEIFKPLAEGIFSQGLRERIEIAPQAKPEPKKSNWLKILLVLGAFGLLSFFIFRKKSIPFNIHKKKPVRTSPDNGEAAPEEEKKRGGQ